ncbi:MAG: flavodoxin, partial [Blautia sp.]|nr:flavodoxin [Blautia sp.]
MILYFTGTGNSKYVADALAHQCGDEAVNANRYIKAGKAGNFHSERPYVFVFPVYLSTIPEVFRTFIKRSKFSGNKDAYFVPTCASASGSVPNAA